MDFERSKDLPITFAPNTYTTIELKLKEQGTPYWSRFDLGIGPDDVKTEGRVLKITVHSLGAKDGAPDAIQVADRWHLWDNLREYVEKTVSAHHRCVRDQPAVLGQAAADQAPDPCQAAGQATTAHAENRVW